jgi:hypothetical protein
MGGAAPNLEGLQLDLPSLSVGIDNAITDTISIGKGVDIGNRDSDIGF